MNTTVQPALLGEVETPRPWRSDDGRLHLTGWCVVDSDPTPPPVRVRCGNEFFPAQPRPRPDLARSLPAQPAAGLAGFSSELPLPAGVHVLACEARLPDGTWHCFKRGTVVVRTPDFRTALDQPVAHGVLRDRVKVGGWAAAPAGRKLRSLELRYGHRSVPCRTGLPRPDAAADSGFETVDFLVAGHGPARLRARLDDGTVRIAATDVTLSIAEDENHPRDLALDRAHRAELPRGERRPAEPAAPAPRRLNVLFLLPGSFASNSALHVAALANELAAASHACAVAVPHDVETVAHHDTPRFRALTFAQAADERFPDGRGPDLVHAWTTREGVRRLAEQVRAAHRCALVVHLEDNEQEVLAQSLGRSFADLAALPVGELDRLVPTGLSHPHRSRDFLAGADGVTLITAKLREFAPAAARTLTLWPAADARHFFPRPVPAEFRAALQLPRDTTVLFYHGNVHAANAAEVRELYAAVARLNEAGVPVTLVRTGLDAVDFLGAHATRIREHVVELGQILHHRHLPPLMALADIFVQPGAPDAFNDYRFPSKLPEFFALGRPVVLPRTNLGEKVRHGIDAYVLERADADGIARAVRELRADPALARRLADGAVRFAAEHFSWRRSAEALAKFYAALAPS